MQENRRKRENQPYGAQKWMDRSFAKRQVDDGAVESMGQLCGPAMTHKYDKEEDGRSYSKPAQSYALVEIARRSYSVPANDSVREIKDRANEIPAHDRAREVDERSYGMPMTRRMVEKSYGMAVGQYVVEKSCGTPVTQGLVGRSCGKPTTQEIVELSYGMPKPQEVVERSCGTPMTQEMVERLYGMRVTKDVVEKSHSVPMTQGMFEISHGMPVTEGMGEKSQGRPVTREMGEKSYGMPMTQEMGEKSYGMLTVQEVLELLSGMPESETYDYAEEVVAGLQDIHDYAEEVVVQSNSMPVTNHPSTDEVVGRSISTQEIHHYVPEMVVLSSGVLPDTELHNHATGTNSGTPEVRNSVAEEVRRSNSTAEESGRNSNSQDGMEWSYIKRQRRGDQQEGTEPSFNTPEGPSSGPQATTKQAQGTPSDRGHSNRLGKDQKGGYTLQDDVINPCEGKRLRLLTSNLRDPSQGTPPHETTIADLAERPNVDQDDGHLGEDVFDSGNTATGASPASGSGPGCSRLRVSVWL